MQATSKLNQDGTWTQTVDSVVSLYAGHRLECFWAGFNSTNNPYDWNVSKDGKYLTGGTSYNLIEAKCDAQYAVNKILGI